MKIALLSDIHANRQAFATCLQHARAHGAEQFALLEAAFPGRVDLGIGRAPGTDQVTAWALRSGWRRRRRRATAASLARSGRTTSSAPRSAPSSAPCR